jgi:hypothetical protein
MMNSDAKIGFSHDHGEYGVKEDLKESGALRSRSTGMIPDPYVWNPGDFIVD